MSNLSSTHTDISHFVVVGLLEVMQEEMYATGSIVTEEKSVDTQIATLLADKKTQIQTMHSLMAMEVGMRARL